MQIFSAKLGSTSARKEPLLGSDGDEILRDESL